MNIETSFCLPNKCAEHYWARTLIFAEWVLIWTTLPPEILSTATIMALYRVRWPIERSGGPGLLDRILPGLSGFLRFRLPAGSAANQSTRYRGFCRQARNVGAVHCKT